MKFNIDEDFKRLYLIPSSVFESVAQVYMYTECDYPASESTDLMIMMWLSLWHFAKNSRYEI